MDVAAVVLAGGYSSRTRNHNIHKMNLDFDGKTLLQRCVETFLDSCKQVIVVGGFEAGVIKELIADYPNVDLIMNTQFDKGMFSSVLAGLKSIEADRVLMTPGDYPLIEANTIRKIIQFDQDVVIPTFQGRRGHPLSLSEKAINRVLTQPEDSNLREAISVFNPVFVEVDDEGILLDVDDLDDYKFVLQKYRNK